MELPVDEEYEEQMVRVPEALKVRSTLLLHRIPDHNPQGEPHNPSGDPGTGCEVGQQEEDDPLFGRVRRHHSKVDKVDHVGDGVNERPEDDGPGGSLVESDVLVEGNDVVQGCPA